jgi:hypothetical protein
MNTEYKSCHNTNLHYAALYKRGKMLAQARNKIGTRARGAGWSECTLHAERAVVKMVGNVADLRNTVMVVVRVQPAWPFREQQALPRLSEVS